MNARVAVVVAARGAMRDATAELLRLREWRVVEVGDVERARLLLDRFVPSLVVIDDDLGMPAVERFVGAWRATERSALVPLLRLGSRNATEACTLALRKPFTLGALEHAVGSITHEHPQSHDAATMPPPALACGLMFDDEPSRR